MVNATFEEQYRKLNLKEYLWLLIVIPSRPLQMTEVTAKLKGLHAELEKTHRGEDKYLTLVTEEHSILKEERELKYTWHYNIKSVQPNSIFQPDIRFQPSIRP